MANEALKNNSEKVSEWQSGLLTKENLNSQGVFDYHKRLVLAFLILKATYRQTTTYEDINEHLEQRGMNWMREPADITAHRELTRYLTEIFHWCRTHNHPHLTALVVRKSGADQGIPGKGFWELLKPADPLQHVDLSDYKTKATMARLFQNHVFDYYQF